MKKEIIIDIIRYLFIILLVYASTSKLTDIEKFKVQIGQSPLITEFALWVAWTIPISEILISLALIIPRFYSFGLYSAFCLMTMFTLYIIAILNIDGHIPCSCGGVLSSMGWTEHLIFNICFVLLGLWGIILKTSHDGKQAYNSIP